MKRQRPLLERFDQCLHRAPASPPQALSVLRKTIRSPSRTCLLGTSGVSMRVNSWDLDPKCQPRALSVPATSVEKHSDFSFSAQRTPLLEYPLPGSCRVRFPVFIRGPNICPYKEARLPQIISRSSFRVEEDRFVELEGTQQAWSHGSTLSIKLSRGCTVGSM